MAFIKKTVKVSDLRNGDTVEVGSKLETVSRVHIKHNELFSYAYKGDPFLSGITKVVFKVPIAGGFRYE